MWPEEKIKKKSIWKYKIKINKIHVVDDIKNKGISPPKNAVLASSRPVIKENEFFELVKDA